MAVENGWGQGAVNNSNDYGKAKANSTNGFGKIYESTNAGLTNIVGGNPVVSISYAFNSFCADASDPTPTVSNNAGAGVFSSTTGLVINSTTGVIDIDASTASTYTVTYTDTDSATAIFDLTIHALPTVTVSVSAGTICVGESTTITASGASSYSWSNGSTGNSITVSPTTTTTFTATGTDSNGCVSSGGTTITVNALPTVEISGTLTYCAGSTTTLTATAGLSSYLWSTGATTQAINVTSGSYTVTGTDSNGCSATSAASTVVEYPLPTVSISGTLEFCAGQNTVLTATAGLSSYLWSNGETTQAITVTSGGSYSVTGTDSNGCSNNDSVSVTEHALPTVSISGTLSFCAGANTTLTASGASTYLWSTGETTASITVSAGGSYSVTGTDSNGCSALDSASVTEYSLPTVSISGTLTYCVGLDTTLDAGAGFASYSWSNGETTQTISATAGNYTVTVTDSNGCSNTSAQVTVTELPLDSATVTYSASAYCQVPTGALAVDGYYPLYANQADANAASSDGASHSHSLTGGTYYMPNAGIVVYHGTYSLTATPTITGQSGTFNSPSGLSIDANGVIDKNASTAGTYSVIYTTNGSCPITVTNSITITALDNATFNFSSSAYCNNVSDPTPTKSASGTFSSSTGLNINTSTGEVDLDASTAGTYVIGFVTSGSCPNSSIQTLTINAAPTVAISGTLSYCAGPSSNTTLNATAGLSSYLWSSGETTQSITATVGSYTVTGTDSNGCSTTSSSVTVTETALDNATFSYSASSYAPTDADPTPTISGLTGGTFSGSTGLVINSTTGEIDLSASTVAAHTITYNTTSSGSSVCPNTSTQNVEIAVAGIANNYSMNFDSASSDYIKSSLLNSLDGLSEMSVSLWIKPSGTSQVAIFLSNPNSLTGSGNFQFAIGLLGNDLRFLEGTNSKFFRTTTAPLTYGQWNHIAISYTAPTALIYVNAVAQSTVQNGVPTTLSNADDGLHIGKDRNGFWNVFDGQIDELAIWNTALTDGTGGTVNQIAEIYNATSTNLTKDLTTVSGSNLVYWNRMGDN